MPPRPRISQEMIIEAAFEIARLEGVEKITAKSVADKLGCSTQPVMYHFKKVSDIRKAAAQRADEFHSACLMRIGEQNPLLDMGLNYIRFAVQEKKLFCLLFQSDAFCGKNIMALMQNPQLQPILQLISQEAEITREQAEQLFRSLFLVVHGYASMLANNDMEYEEEAVAGDLKLVFLGALGALREKI